MHVLCRQQCPRKYVMAVVHNCCNAFLLTTQRAPATLEVLAWCPFLQAGYFGVLSNMRWPDLPLWMLRWRPVLSTGRAKHSGVVGSPPLLLWPVSELVRRHKAWNGPKNSHRQNGPARCQGTEWVKTEYTLRNDIKINNLASLSLKKVDKMICDCGLSGGLNCLFLEYFVKVYKTWRTRQHAEISAESLSEICFQQKNAIFVSGGFGNFKHSKYANLWNYK